jgi:uncharacterized protein (DUF2164 family)
VSISGYVQVDGSAINSCFRDHLQARELSPVRIAKKRLKNDTQFLQIIKYFFKTSNYEDDLFMRNDNAIRITKEKRDEMIAAIKNYFLKEREEEIGDLAAGITLDFIIQELAPEFYNMGVYDSHKYMEEMIGDLLSLQK